jgi:hypothetical protein
MGGTTKRKGRHGSIGQEIFTQIEELIAKEKMSRSEAFRRLGERTGRRSGTVAANYYRIARKSRSGGASRRKLVRGSSRSGTAARKAGRLFNELVAVIQEQDLEMDRLRKDNERLQQVRKLLGRT